MNKNEISTLLCVADDINNKKSECELTDKNEKTVCIFNKVKTDIIGDKIFLSFYYDNDCTMYFLNSVTQLRADERTITLRLTSGEEIEMHYSRITENLPLSA